MSVKAWNPSATRATDPPAEPNQILVVLKNTLVHPPAIVANRHCCKWCALKLVYSGWWWEWPWEEEPLCEWECEPCVRLELWLADKCILLERDEWHWVGIDVRAILRCRKRRNMVCLIIVVLSLIKKKSSNKLYVDNPIIDILNLFFQKEESNDDSCSKKTFLLAYQHMAHNKKHSFKNCTNKL